MSERAAIVRVRPGHRRPGDESVLITGAEEPRSGTDREQGRLDVRFRDGDVDGWRTAREVEVVVGGWQFELEVEDAIQAALRERARRDDNERAYGGPVEVRAIIPGRVVSVDVAVGDRVEAGGHLLVLEAMKMQNEMQAPRAGRVAQVRATAGLTVDRGDLLVVLEAEDPAGVGDRA